MNGRAILVASCVACAACTLLVDAGDLSGEGAATANDAGGDSGVATDSDARADAGDDAPGDGSPAAKTCPDGGFCDDFERMDVQGKWDSIGQNGASTISIDGTVASSGSSSLHIVLDATADDKSRSFLSRNFVGQPSKLRFSADVRVATPITRDMHFLTFEVFQPVHRALYFILTKTGLSVAEQEFGTQGSFNIVPSGAIPPGAWHHVVLEIEPAARNYRTELDGEPRAVGTTMVDFASSPSFDAYLGNVYAVAGDRAEIWFDDYRIEPTY